MGEPAGTIVETLTLRFIGEYDRGLPIHELRAAHVAEVLQGIVGLSSDFTKSDTFFEDEHFSTELYVKPAKEGSFLLEIVRVLNENAGTISTVVGVTGGPTLATVIFWATKSFRAEVKDFDYLPNGMVKVIWQDDTVDEVPVRAWDELNKKKRRRKRFLRQIMAPLSDVKISSIEVVDMPAEQFMPIAEKIEEVGFVLNRDDYDLVQPEDDIEEFQDIFEVEAQMSAIDFDDPTKWRVKTRDRSRSVRVEDPLFLNQVANGLAIRNSDIFRLKIREDVTIKNGRSSTIWTVLEVKSYRNSSSAIDE